MTTNIITILGATGSIGSSTLDIIRHQSRLGHQWQIHALSGFSQLDKLFALCAEFRPNRVCVPSDKVDKFAHRLSLSGLDIDVVGGQAGLMDLASDEKSGKIIAGIVGSAGLRSTLTAVNAGKTVLLANKESLVMAGDLVMQTARTQKATILPIDSEHNAIFQCLPQVVQMDNVAIHQTDFGIKQLWLTASGGGFLYKSYEDMQNATVAQAVKHPNWNMGQKISIDSATMMNKGLELIEACHLFNLDESQIQIAIHPQSIVHSMVEYIDGSVLAQLGEPDMKTPIAHALAYPKRMSNGVKPLSLFEIGALEFICPDKDKFKALDLARAAAKAGNGACIALNASNEILVSAFLNHQIRLTDIADTVEKVLNDGKLHTHFNTNFHNIDDILLFDERVRAKTHTYLKAM